MKALPYTPELAPAWNAFVRTSRNGTFLLDRNFMDYHSDRFKDGSLLFYTANDQLTAVLPANLKPEQKLVQSHGGLTYGGLLLSQTATLTDVRDAFVAAAEHYAAQGYERLAYKPVPAIYHTYPAEEDLYWLFRAQAVLTERTVSSTILLNSPLAQALWHRKTKKKACEGLTLETGNATLLRDFWAIVDDVLSSRHHTHPVHTLAEISLLSRRFPDSIRLFTATDQGRVVAGCLAFITETTFHVQYMEAGDEGRRRRALDWLMARLIGLARDAGLRFLDFGISTEDGGRFLNDGLAYQKEGFGGRAICYDTYEAEIPKLMTL